ncbi:MULTISPECIES: hypothetical protein [unclassified Brevundimonas]|uniref:hypothetical protein n=1 Tax=unclassified Brevundimonas TaxID=2622653 RepID=UPI000C3C91BF|nr:MULTISPECIES: hypothetical protein [unclassified Brevundimonas]MAL88594.1 hypothetical protein [Brevundimonas sp.]MAL89683.1 hypothetical protein [Brevundimonas sp.]HAV51589.1 hypothetical protein [Brevundimonas sp.]
MKFRDVSRFTPVHWILIAGALICFAVAGVQVLGSLGFRWDPFNAAEHRAEVAEGKAAVATADAGARSAEASGARQTTRLVEQAAADREAADAVAHDFALQREAQADDSIPLPDDGAALRDSWQRLCDLRTSVCAGHGDAAPARDAGKRDPAVPPARAAEQAVR